MLLRLVYHEGLPESHPLGHQAYLYILLYTYWAWRIAPMYFACSVKSISIVSLTLINRVYTPWGSSGNPILPYVTPV